MIAPTALITGGSSGIGLAISEQLIAKGYQIFSVSRNPGRGPKTPNFVPLEFDLFDLDKIAEFSEDFMKQHGVPEILINNAGYGAFYDWASFPEEQIVKQSNLLFTSPVLLCRYFAPAMQQRGSGTILNLSSLATLYPLPFMPLYNAGKSALSSFTESMMLEYFDCPKFIDFRMGDVRTKFNQSARVQARGEQSSSMKKAWDRIEWQLERSPSAKTAADQILKTIECGKSGRFYGGGFFHRVFLPLIRPIFFRNINNFILRRYYEVKNREIENF